VKTWQRILLGPKATVRDALLSVDAAGSQIALVVDEERRLLGTLTDGDIRRGLINGLALTDPVERCMCGAPTTVRLGEPRDAILALMRRTGLHHVPIIDAAGVVVGLETRNDYFVPHSRETWVVLMAGGRGVRLRELTETTPKPMLNVGGRPVLETQLRTFLEQGFKRFFIAVNYLAESIEDYFGDGRSLGADIHYLREKKPLGTAGALTLLPERSTEPVIVTNGDVLTTVDYVDLLAAHNAAAAVGTMAVREYEMQIPYGVIVEQEGAVKQLHEKPVRKELVSAGIYVLSPPALERIPRDTHFDMPRVFEGLIGAGLKVSAYRIQGYWIDIGRVADLEQANIDFVHSA
jgi:dTDP-glucose pyrophosphorylase